MAAKTGAERTLRLVVAQIANEKPITAVTVTEVCRRAQVTRDTFYRFASSPVALLADYLYEDHDTVRVTPSSDPAEPQLRALGPATRLLLEHIQRNQRIYQNALSPRLPMELREALLRRLESVLYAHARAFPEKLPDVQGERPDEETISALVHHASNGVVGTVEYLVTSDRLAETDRMIAVLHAATAQGWLTYD